MKNLGILPERVAVVDEKNKYLSHTHPARVRKLLKQGKAEVFSKDPFTIKLKGEKGKVMKPQIITNFTEYFKEERDVYVQNISNTQISMQFETAPGRYDSVTLPRTRKPFNLTQHIPFEAVKRSTDVRRLVNRRPTVMKLLSEEEYNKYYENLAKSMGTSMDEEIENALEEQAALMNRWVSPVTKESDIPKSMDELAQEREEDPEEAAEIQPLPRVIGLCTQVGPDVPKEEKMKVNEMMSELEAMESELRLTDLEYITSRGHYSSIKKWAAKRMEDMSPEEGE